MKNVTLRIKHRFIPWIICNWSIFTAKDFFSDLWTTNSWSRKIRLTKSWSTWAWWSGCLCCRFQWTTNLRKKNYLIFWFKSRFFLVFFYLTSGLRPSYPHWDFRKNARSAYVIVFELATKLYNGWHCRSEMQLPFNLFGVWHGFSAKIDQEKTRFT